MRKACLTYCQRISIRRVSKPSITLAYPKKTVLSLSALVASANKHCGCFCEKPPRPVRMSRFNQNPYRQPYPVEKTFRTGYFSGTEERGLPHRGTMSPAPRNGALPGAGENDCPQPWAVCKKKSQYTCPCRRTPTILKGLKDKPTPRTPIHKKNDGPVWNYRPFWLLSSKNQARCPNKPSTMLRQRILSWTDRFRKYSIIPHL